MSVNEIAMLILFGSFFIMIICKMPVSIALATSSGLTMLYLGVPLMTMVQSMAKAVNNFSLMAIPFFILMGEIMGAGGISDRIVDFAKVLVGRFRGGLAQVNCLDSMLFGGISGSAVADVSSLGSIVIPMMKKSGYEEDFSVALTVTTSCQGVLIPPSHNMIIYAVAAGGVSVGRLFMGGLIPGIFLGVCLMIITAVISIRRNYPKEDPVPLKQALIITKDAFLALVTLLIIMVGVTAGFFTATESAAIACVYSFIISVFVYRKLKLRQMPELLLNTVKTLAMVFSLIAAAGAFGWVMAYLQVPKMITNALIGITNSKVIILLIINFILLILGCIMDMSPLILIMTPILLPVVTSFGMSPVQFGVVMIYNLAIGLCTPPVGSALFVGSAIGKVKLERVVKAMWPMYIAMFVGLMLVTFIPELSLWLPSVLIK